MRKAPKKSSTINISPVMLVVTIACLSVYLSACLPVCLSHLVFEACVLGQCRVDIVLPLDDVDAHHLVAHTKVEAGVHREGGRGEWQRGVLHLGGGRCGNGYAVVPSAQLFPRQI